MPPRRDEGAGPSTAVANYETAREGPKDNNNEEVNYNLCNSNNDLGS